MTLELSATQRASFDADGYVIVDRLIDPKKLPTLHKAFDDLFSGVFETGVRPDEVLDETIGKAIANLAGWSGVRIMIDNVIWKAPATKSLGFHQDNAFLSWFDPGEIMTCWIALDDTTAEGGTIEFAKASHRWVLGKPEGEFHAPADYRKPVHDAAERAGVKADIHFVEVGAGGGSFHHGKTWHGSGANLSANPRRSLVLHAMPSEVQYVPANFDQGIGPIYSRYKRLGDSQLDENFFPILWRDDDYRTPQIDDYLNN